jgi:Mrp family chromosome partitioning ATPase
VNAPLAKGRARYAAGETIGAPYRPRRRSPGAQAFAALTRAGARGLPLFAVLTAAVATCGVLVAATQGPVAAETLIFWSGAGACAAFGVGLWLELTRRTVTSVASLGAQRGFAVLGGAPELAAGQFRDLPPDQRTPLGCLAFQPASPFATAFRDLQGALVDDRIVAFLSPEPSDAAALTAMCAAASAAQQGRRTIIVDCDIRARVLTVGLGIAPDRGIEHAAAHPADWRDLVGEEPETGLAYLPATRARSRPRILATDRGFVQVLGELAEDYDLVVLSCPAANAAAGGIAFAARAQKIVLAAAWDETSVSALRTAIRTLRRLVRAPIGVFVANVPGDRRFGRLRPS